MSLTGLQFINLELTSQCNKSCWMCGRRKIEKEHPEKMHWGNMSPFLAEKIVSQLPSGIVVAFHNNGEPLMYPYLKRILPAFKNQIRVVDTNGKLLVAKADEIINNFDTLTVSVIENDPDGDEQYEVVKQFLALKQDQKPRLIYRLLGEVKDADRWKQLPGIIATRILHNPMGSFKYTKKTTVPEIGICLEALTHLAIDRYGNVSMCVRFDPDGLGRIGNLKEQTLEEIWNGEKRQKWIKMHVEGYRNEIPLCSKCEFWGIPKGD